MNQFHVGRGMTRGALTVFPIWAEVDRPVSYSMDHSRANIGERPDGPIVGSLLVENTDAMPLLLLESQLLKGGMQHRMVARSTLLAPGDRIPLEVVCVEQGRWHGTGRHAAQARRASTRVRDGLRSADRQGEVWRRVAGYEHSFGSSRTSSFLEQLDRAQGRVRELVRGLRPFPGQVGILIGLAGQPLTAEIFDSHHMLVRQFDEIVRAAAMDAVRLPPGETPGRRARRFMDRAAQVPRQVTGRAGIAQTVTGHTDHVDLSAVRWDGHELHTLLTNTRHELLLAT